MKALTKDFVREVKNTRTRFLSILVLVALAVAFLSGLKATAPDMKGTLDEYMDAKRFMDIQVFSTLGLTEDDIELLRQQPGVAAVEGSHQLDVFAKGQERDLVVKLYGMPGEINDITVKKGRLPEAPDECAADKKLLGDLGLSIGDRLVLDPGEGNEDALKIKEFTIVGTVASPYYISVERGTASIGSGSVSAFLYVPDEAFDLEYYTSAYVLADGAQELTAFSDDYNDAVDGLVDDLKPFGDARAQNRYDTLIGDANRELDKAQKELDDAKAEADQKISDAEAELADARRKLDDGWRKLQDGRNTFRTESEDAWRQIADAEAELSDAWDQLVDARSQLDDAEKELKDGEAELEDAWEQLVDAEAELADGKKQLDDGEAELADAWEQLEDAKKQLDDGKRELQDGEAELSDGYAEYYAGVAQIRDAEQQLQENEALYTFAKTYMPQAEQRLSEIESLWENRTDDVDVKAYAKDLLERAYSAAASADISSADLGRLRDAIDDIEQRVDDAEDIDDLIDQGFENVDGYIQQGNDLIKQYEDGAAQVESGKKQLDDAWNQLRSGERALERGWDQYYDGVKEYEAGLKEYEDGKKKLEDAKKEYEDGLAEYQDGLDKYNDGKAKLEDGRKEYEDGLAEYQDGLQKYNDGKAELEKNKEELPGKLADAQKELDDAYRELMSGEEEYEDGYQEYLSGKAEAEEKIADAQEKLSDARRDISKITGCEWYILSRSSNPGYLGFGQDADRMANLAKVFPMLFFLVAALVCLTTMTRMVDDQRIQIGSLKALGYGRLQISMKYLAYGALPAVAGGILGLVIGYILFPTMIFTAYQIMYEVPSLTLRQYTGISAFSLIAAISCTTLATLWACISTLRAVPAQLMRPKAPAAGKRVFLEYIKPLWKRMGFFQKLTARNLFRYQKRFWMTVIGIGGCTALIIAGFGLRYSLLATMSRQYEEIFRYQAQLSVDKDIIEEDREAIERFLGNHPDILEVMPAYMNAVTAETSKYQTTAYLQVCEPEQLADFVDLHTFSTNEPITLTENGVIINQKLSELLGIKDGESFTMDSGTRSELTVNGINEHYLAHFIYMTPSAYTAATGKTYAPNTYQLILKNNDGELCKAIFEDFMKMEGASGTSRVYDVRDTYLSAMERIDFVVVIIILCAAALAIVVLYNLSNINITERQRELATIKVLGFYDGEVSAYIYRENIVLTIIGIILGILSGHVLHVWLVYSVEIDLMMFGRDTNPNCYLYAAVLTAVFSFIVNVAAHFKMKKINMVESLKSAE